MNNPQFSPTNYVFSGASELVQGQEQKLLDELNPLVRDTSRRISTLAPSSASMRPRPKPALVTLYCDACKAGRSFKVRVPATLRGDSRAGRPGPNPFVRTLGRYPRFNCQLQETAA